MSLAMTTLDSVYSEHSSLDFVFNEDKNCAAIVLNKAVYFDRKTGSVRYEENKTEKGYCFSFLGKQFFVSTWNNPERNTSVLKKLYFPEKAQIIFVAITNYYEDKGLAPLSLDDTLITKTRFSTEVLGKDFHANEYVFDNSYKKLFKQQLNKKLSTEIDSLDQYNKAMKAGL